MTIAFGLSYALPWDVTAAINVYREFYHAPAWWAEFDLSRNFKLPWYAMNVDTAFSLGYLDRSFNSALLHNNQLEAGQILASLNIPFCNHFTVSPKIGLAFPLTDAGSKDLMANSVDGQDTHVFGGVRIGAAF